MSTAAQPEKKSWYKKTWIWVVVGVVILVGVISNLINPRTSDDAATTPSATPSLTQETEPTTQPEDAETPAEEPPAPSPTSADFETSIKTALGVSEFSELLAADPSLWGGYISGVSVDGSNAFVTLQVSASDPSRKDLGERAAQALSTLLPSTAVEGISWIVVEDASGVVIDQKQPAPLS